MKKDPKTVAKSDREVTVDVIVSQLETAISMTRYFLPKSDFLANLLLMALIEAKRGTHRRRGKAEANGRK